MDYESRGACITVRVLVARFLIHPRAAQLVGQIFNRICNNGPVAGCREINPLVDAVFCRPIDIGSLHTLIASRREIIIMRRSHHHLFGLKLKKAYRVLVDGRVAFKRAMHVTGKNEIPWDA